MQNISDISTENDEFISFLSELKSRLTRDKFLEIKAKFSEDLTIQNYFNIFITKCLDECRKIDYNSFSNIEKKFLDKNIARLVYPLIAKELKVA